MVKKGSRGTNSIEAGPSSAFIGIKLDGTVLETRCHTSVINTDFDIIFIEFSTSSIT